MAKLEIASPYAGHRDRILENIGISWTNETFVGDRLFPKVTVPFRHDIYRVWGYEAFRPMDDRIQASGEALEIEGPAVDEDGYRCRGKALSTAISDYSLHGKDPGFDVKTKMVQNLMDKFWMARELRIVNMVRDPDNYHDDLKLDLATNIAGGTTPPTGPNAWKNAFGTGGTLSGGNFTATRTQGDCQWDKHASSVGSTSSVLANTYQSDPIGAVNMMKDRIHKKAILDPRTMVIPHDVYRALERHPALTHLIQFVMKAVTSRELVASLLDVDEIIIPRCLYDKSPHDQEAVLEYMWEKDVILAYVPKSAGMDVPAFAYEFVYAPFGELEVTRWREPSRKREVIRVERWSDLKFIAKDQPNDNGKSIVAFFLQNVVS